MVCRTVSLIALTLVVAVATWGCSEESVACSNTDDCAHDEVCVDGYCEEGEPGDFNISEPNRGQENDEHQSECPEGGCAARMFTPHTVNFLNVPAGETYTELTFLRSRGEEPLIIDDIAVTSGSDFDVTFPGEPAADGSFGPPEQDRSDFEPTVLEPGEEKFVRVWFRPDDEEESNGTMTIMSNAVAGDEHTVDLRGNFEAGCMLTTHDDGVDFGAVTIGQTAVRTITLENCAMATELEIHALTIAENDGGVFAIPSDGYPGDLPGSVLRVPGKERVTVAVAYTPEQEVQNDGELLISSTNQYDPQLRLPLSGRGTTTVCPDAEIDVVGESTTEEVLQVEPLQTLQLTGENSQGPQGAAIEEYQWSLVDFPATAHPHRSLEPSSTAVDPELLVDVTGSYRVELTVVDEQGNSSCSSAVLDIEAVPERDIYLEATWHPVFSTDTERGEGIDLRLHYVHPNGVWGSREGSLYQTTADDEEPPREWGPGEARILQTDSWGEFPEVIAHDDPEPGYGYEVGIHKNYDYTLGAADATMKVYLQGLLAGESKDRRIHDIGDLWHVGTVEWGETPEFVEVDEMVDDHQIPLEEVSWP